MLTLLTLSILCRLQVLNVVKLDELAAFVRRDEVVKLFQRLPAEVAAIDQKKDAPGARMFDQAIDKIDRRKGLAAAGGHLDQRARPVLGERFFEILDRFNLSEPELPGNQRRHLTQRFG